VTELGTGIKRDCFCPDLLAGLGKKRMLMRRRTGVDWRGLGGRSASWGVVGSGGRARHRLPLHQRPPGLTRGFNASFAQRARHE